MDIEEWFERDKGTCVKKQQFQTEQDAENAAYRAKMEFQRELTAYQCEWCGQWHLTS